MSLTASSARASHQHNVSSKTSERKMRLRKLTILVVLLLDLLRELLDLLGQALDDKVFLVGRDGRDERRSGRGCGTGETQYKERRDGRTAYGAGGSSRLARSKSRNVECPEASA